MIVLIEKLNKVKLSDCRQEIREKLFPADVQDNVFGPPVTRCLCHGEHKSCKYLSFWNLLSQGIFLLEFSTVMLWNTLEHSTE